jgi:glycosyltransferase involved in cell wall biosynthesis
VVAAIRILQVIPYFTPIKGGDVDVCYNLSSALARFGHDVTIATTDFEFDREYAKSIEGENLHIIRFHCVASAFSYFISPEMKKWIKTNINHYDVIHLHNFRSYQNNIAYRYAKEHGIPLILQPDASTPRMISRKGLKWLYDILYGYKMLRGATKVIAISEEETIYDQKAGVKAVNLVLIYTGMPVERFENLPAYGRFRKKFAIDPDKFMILYLGRLHKSKGISHVIRAFKEMATTRNDTILIIVGPDSGYRRKLEMEVSNLGLTGRARFIGSVDEEDKIGAYVDADLFVHIVEYMGGVGITPLEAILCGTPVMVSPQCGEIIRKADCGYIVTSTEESELARIMSRALDNYEENRRMIERGQRYIAENLSWDMVARRIEKCYEDCIRTPR